ncbi:MAG: CHASE domain-containing protein [Planctomycetes bacterium]|nr:CHASE domain-containing protein [Planctomycetota bacterium]
MILGLSLLATAWAWYLSDAAVHRRSADRFHFRTEEVQLAIRDRMASYIAILRGGAGLFMASPEVGREAWRRYVDSLELGRSFPGIQGLGFTRVIQPQELAAHVAAVRAEGFPDYSVRPAGERPLYTAIVYLEPFDWRNQRAFGFDMYTEETRRQAMDRARDGGEPMVSGKVVLVQETEVDRQRGFLVYLPVFRPGLPAATAAERRAALMGYVYAPFRMQDLMHGILGRQVDDLHLHIYDGEGVDEGRLLAPGVPTDAVHAGPPIMERTVVFALPGGHCWTLVFHADTGLVSASEETLPLLVAACGLVIDLLLFLVIAGLAGRERRIRSQVLHMTRDLRRSEERLAQSLEAVGDGVWDWDVARGAVYFSDTWKAMLGHATHEVGSGLAEWSSRVHPDDLARVLAEVEEHLAGRTATYRSEHRVRCKDGRFIWILDRGRAIERDPGGRALRLVGTHTDITGQRLLQEERDRLVATLEERVQERTAELAARDRRLRIVAAVFEQIPSAIAISDAGRRITYANPACALRFGAAAGPFAGRPHLEAVFPATAAAESAAALAALARGEAWSGVITLEVDGQRRWLDALVMPVAGEDGEPVGFASVHRDITAMRQAEAEARQRTEELIQADKMAALGTLVAGVGHEINNPANFISLNTPLLKGFWADAVPVLEARAAADPGFRLGRIPWARTRELVPRLFQGLEEGIGRIRRIVGDLRDFARPDPGHDQPQDLNRVVQAAVAITRHAVARSTGRFSLALGDGLPPVAGSFQKLEQVVVNLLLNASQALPAGDRAITLSTALDPGTGRLVLTVADQGVGIPPEHLARLGEPFFTTKRDQGGTGLGLSIIRRIIQDHGGEIRFASVLGAGTTVTVLLPAAPGGVAS